MNIINKSALSHLPCSFCQRPAGQINVTEGSVTFNRFGKDTVVILRRLCGACNWLRMAA